MGLRIAFVNGISVPYSGSSRFNSERANYLASQGHDVVFVVSKFRGRPEWMNDSIPVFDCHPPKNNHLQSIVTLRAATSEVKPDLIIANDSTSTIAGFGICPLIRYSHGGHALDSKAFISSGARYTQPFSGLMHDLSYRVADAVVANSEWCARSFQKFRVRAIVNYPGVDSKRFVPIHKEMARARLSSAGLLREKGHVSEIVLSVGSLQRLKRQRLLVAAFAIIAKKFKNAILVVIGSGPDEHAIRALISHYSLNERVLLFSESYPRDNILLLWYSAATVFVHPAEREHFGLVTAEAQSCGTPCVVPDEGGGTEIVRDKVTGFHFKALDYESCAAKMEFLLNDSVTASEMGKNGRNRVIKKFELEQANREFGRVIDEVIGPLRIGDARAPG